MNLDLFRFSPGAYLAPAVDWLNKNFHPFFDALTKLIEAVLGAIETALLYPPPYATIVVAVLLAAFFVSVRVSVVTAIALAFCLLAGFSFPFRSPSRLASWHRATGSSRPRSDPCWTSCRPCRHGSISSPRS